MGARETEGFEVFLCLGVKWVDKVRGGTGLFEGIQREAEFEAVAGICVGRAGPPVEAGAEFGSSGQGGWAVGGVPDGPSREAAWVLFG